MAGAGTGTPATDSSSTKRYATVADLSGRLDIIDTDDDLMLASILDAVSRWIDHYCGRHFWYETATRYYTAGDSALFLCPDDIISITMMYTDDDGDRGYSITWAATDFELEPYNAALKNRPYTAIRTAPVGRYAFPAMRKGIKITGVFGFWTAVPDEVEEACLLLSERIYQRKNAIFGVMGSIETGMMMITDFDPDAALLLRPFVRIGALAV